MRWQHIALAVANATTVWPIIDIPAIPGIAHLVRRIRVGATQTVDGDLGWALSHFLEQEVLASAGFPSFWNIGALWLRGGFHSLGGGDVQDIRFDAADNVMLAGPQAVGWANGSGVTRQVFLEIGYEDRRMPIPDWTLLKARTSFEED